MAWITLVIAGFFETAWAVGLKYSEGFTKLWLSLWTIVTMALSVFLLGHSIKSLPVGTAYAVWTGIGAVGTAILGIIIFNDPKSLPRIISMLLIVAGIIGLKFFSGE